MKFLKTSLLMAALMTGCATTPKVEQGYDHSASYALNVWRASGMEGEMKDTKVPSSKIGSAFDSGSGRLLGIYSDASMAKLGGLDPSVALGAGLFVALFEPEKPAFRDSFFYWEEYREGESELDARKRIMNVIKAAVEEALSSSGLDLMSFGVLTSKDEKTMLGFADFTGGNTECAAYAYTATEKTSPCSVMIMLPTLEGPKKGPAIMGLDTKLYWHQSARDITRGEMEIRFWKKDYEKTRKEMAVFLSSIKSLDLLTKISGNLPKNYCLYLAPKNKTFDTDGKQVDIPLILERGNSFGFIIEDDLVGEDK